MDYLEKYLKYKNKYLNYNKQLGGRKKKKRYIPLEYVKTNDMTKYGEQDYIDFATELDNNIKEYINNDNLMPYYDNEIQ